MSTQTNTPAAPAKKRAAARTPQQKAQDAVDAAQARYDRAKASSDRLKTAAADAEQTYQDSIAEYSAATDALAWAKKNPDLTKKVSQDTTGGIGSTETSQS